MQTLCEKGLAAMESSHKRVISDLEEKHRKEIERLLAEKEQALAEETQVILFKEKSNSSNKMEIAKLNIKIEIYCFTT